MGFRELEADFYGLPVDSPLLYEQSHQAIAFAGAFCGRYATDSRFNYWGAPESIQFSIDTPIPLLTDLVHSEICMPYEDCEVDEIG